MKHEFHGNPTRWPGVTVTLLFAAVVLMSWSSPTFADVPADGTGGVRTIVDQSVSVPNPGTQQQELANITFPAPYNVYEFVVTCAACHGGTIDQQVAHFGNWAGTSMASAMRDPVFRANQMIINNAIKNAVGQDGAGNMCIRCHSPNAWYSGRTDPLLGGAADGSTVEHSIVLSTDDEGILCEMCHRTMGGVTMMRADLAADDPAWNMLAGIRDWPHAGLPFPDGPAAGLPYGDTALQINDGMAYGGKYPGSVDVLFSDLPLLGSNYTGQTFAVDRDGFPLVNPDGSVALHYEEPIPPPLVNGVYDLQAQSVSLEHPTFDGEFVKTSEFCGTCHDLTVPILNHGMPEQRTYSEWKYSAYSQIDPATGRPDKRCQDCHMPTLKHEYADGVAVSLNPDPVLAGWFPYAKDRNGQGGTAFHKLVGANRDLPQMMTLLYPEVDLEVIGAPTGRDTRIFPGMLSSRDSMWDRARRNTEISLNDAVDLQILQPPTWNATLGKWELVVRVTNLAGHRIPSGYPDGRRFWLNVEVEDAIGSLVYESGHYDATSATLFNDASLGGFTRAQTPLIDSAANAVMVYEKRTGTSNGDGTYSMSVSLLNEKILFDNRIPPLGYDPTGYNAAGTRFYVYSGSESAAVPVLDPGRFPAGQNWDDVTYLFDAPADAILSTRVTAYWQTHTREFMEHLKESDASALRPEGPPSILDANYPLTPNYLGDVIGIDALTDLAGNPLNDNWGGVAYAAWMETGMGAPFAAAVADTRTGTPPAAPTVTATTLDLFSIGVDWAPVADAEGYVLWTRYGLDTLPEDDPSSTASWDRLAVLDPVTTSFTHDALNVGKSYQYKVLAFNSQGMSADSNVVVATTFSDVPLMPTNLQVVGVTDTTATLSWFDQSDNAIGFILERQDVPLLTSDPFPPFVQVADIPHPGTQGVSYTDIGLLPGRTYNYRVAAYSTTGLSLWNDNGPVAATTLGPPAAPTGLVVTFISGIQVDLSWIDNSGSELGFRVERAEDIDFTVNPASFVLGSNITTFSDTSVLPSTLYFYRVYAFNTFGDSLVPSNTVSTTTLTEPPANPSRLTAALVAPTTVQLDWQDNATTETAYVVQRSTDGILFADFATLPVDSISYLDNSVAPAMTYWYRVYALNDGGPSGFTNTASVVVPGQIPEAPAELQVTKVNKTKVTLAWLDRSTNEEGFHIERSTDNATWNRIATVGINETGYQDRTVTRGTTYWYRVQSYNVIGASAYTDPPVMATPN